MTPSEQSVGVFFVDIFFEKLTENIQKCELLVKKIKFYRCGHHIADATMWPHALAGRRFHYSQYRGFSVEVPPPVVGGMVGAPWG